MPVESFFFNHFTSSVSFLRSILLKTIFNFLPIGVNLSVLPEAYVLFLTKPYILTISLCVLLPMILLLRQKKKKTPTTSSDPKRKWAAICKKIGHIWWIKCVGALDIG